MASRNRAILLQRAPPVGISHGARMMEIWASWFPWFARTLQAMTLRERERVSHTASENAHCHFLERGWGSMPLGLFIGGKPIRMCHLLGQSAVSMCYSLLHLLCHHHESCEMNWMHTMFLPSRLSASNNVHGLNSHDPPLLWRPVYNFHSARTSLLPFKRLSSIFSFSLFTKSSY